MRGVGLKEPPSVVGEGGGGVKGGTILACIIIKWGEPHLTHKNTLPTLTVPVPGVCPALQCNTKDTGMWSSHVTWPTVLQD